ncbi:hypothetical protein CI109_101792 [Kwoniella shandongensis]|uniref:Uncharacterized protein n=1 Tax=Kwoniella shandongensis TaxID=1734106 RepID=A0A5M6C559_9TREE|nr:uncharacterized protein CI109_001086 [Kwoniella shandongensis]KAA5530286.1 hypothetical protein CI109_001086 [Kwoniella shandongensis]
MASKRLSMASPGPLSPSTIPRPHSSAGQARIRQVSDAGSTIGESSTPDSRNVRVVLRIRPSYPEDPNVPPRFRSVLVHPTSQAEVRLDVDPATLAGHGTGSMGSGSKRHPTFTFDHVLGEEAGQTELYDVTARETVDEFVKGHNVTFLAYGQTSSGKSYSMGTTGEDVDYHGTDFTPRTGLIPRTVQAIFERAEEIRQQSGTGSSWECRLSFLELYNEEIIDLLSGTGVAITIREERDGRIVWAGVREVKVKTLAEVMNLLQEGSERRKTGETTMNASSSRSHAIFSLTLVQKKRSGAVALPTPSRSETPTRQLRRPSSTIGFPGASSAASTRSPTPSTPRGGPPSSFGRMAPSRPASMMLGAPLGNGGGGGDEYVILTSKFNMVDLAGSERLKRTAAQGDRMKEGISINSGLSALGNVISTLSDPNKARGHIPYRDSKLTRMLQDSIGGNALTTMIACVSPIEANIGETINTIKYASRARNIRNVSKINQVEAGWDDVEHLQSTVQKLRKQLSALEAGEGKGSTSEENLRQSEKLIQRLAELQREHTELYDRYLQKCSENMRLSSELRNRGPGDGDALSKFNETVEPVIVEYEKVVSALNQQLDELREELSAMNETLEEQDRELQETRERYAQNETYVSELRGRLAKLTERNTSSEAYVQDLEAKLKAHSDKEDSHSGTVTELKKDIAHLREENTSLTQHASEIEARLLKSEALSTTLAAQVEKHEREAQRREAAHKDLEAHIALLDTSKDSKALLKELEERDRRIAELQDRLEEKSTFETNERSSLLETVDAEKSIRADLQSRLESLQASTTTGPVSPPSEHSDEAMNTVVEDRTPLRTTRELTPPESPQSSGDSNTNETGELEALKAALKELSEKYTDAESRVADLTSQLSEARLVQSEIDDVIPISPATPSPDQNEDDDASETGTVVQTPRGPSPSTSPSKRRGSMPVISSVAVKGGQGSGFRGGRGYGDSKRTRPQSLSQELSSAQSSGLSPRASASWGRSNTLLLSSPTVSGSQAASKPLRSPHSLEAELKFVHRIVEERDEELKDREAYIQQLEERLQGSHDVIPSRKTSASTNKQSSTIEKPKTPRIKIDTRPQEVPLPSSPQTPRKLVVTLPDTDRAFVDADGLRPPEKGEVEVGRLSPKSEKRFTALKNSLNKLSENGEDIDETQMKVRELMKEMEDKEASQRQMIEQQFVQIADLQKANNRLKEEVAERGQSGYPTAEALEAMRRERDNLIAEKSRAASSPSSTPSMSEVEQQGTIDRLRQEHAEEVQLIISGHAHAIDVLEKESAKALDKLRSAIDTQGADHQKHLADLQQKHDQALSELKTSHEQTLQAMAEENDLIAQEMESSLSEGEEQRRQLKMRADQALFELSRVRDQSALQRNIDAKQITELTRAKEQLEKVKTELEVVNAELMATNLDLSKRNGELEQRYSKKLVAIPPQGPPPTTPLPPLPLKLEGATTNDYFSSVRQSSSSTGHWRESSTEEARSSSDDVDGLKRELGMEREKVKDIEIKLQEEKVKVNNLTIDLRESNRTNSKLRVHLDDARQEVQRTTAACQDHIAELDARRSQMSTLSEERKSQRDSLMAAEAKVATLKAQLERAVETKMDKRLLKCF